MDWTSGGALLPSGDGWQAASPNASSSDRSKPGQRNQRGAFTSMVKKEWCETLKKRGQTKCPTPKRLLAYHSLHSKPHYLRQCARFFGRHYAPPQHAAQHGDWVSGNLFYGTHAVRTLRIGCAEPLESQVCCNPSITGAMPTSKATKRGTAEMASFR